MRPNPQFPAELLTFPEEILNGKLQFLCNDNDPLLFDVLYKITHELDRETIYNGMKSNVINYDLKPFHTEYGYLDGEYWYITMFAQDYTQQIEGACSRFI